MMIIQYILLFCLFVSRESVKICANCKYFIPGNTSSPQLFYAKCAAFPKMKTIDLRYLVLGTNNEEDIDDYYHCSTARNNESLCGK